MPTREPLLDIELGRLIDEYGFRFEEFPPPRRWPEKHKNHFRAIDEIAKTRYDEYKAKRDIPEDRKNKLRNRVNHLRERANHLRDDGSNESTWRMLEHHVLQKFDRRVICSICGDESWMPDFPQADFGDDLSSLNLAEKRRKRKACNCEINPRSRKIANDDDENRLIFAIEKEQCIAHTSDNELKRLKIPMKPDLAIGLRPRNSMPPNTTHYPVVGQKILLPFLVVEAKREENAPGFRAIQEQTAFPIRSFLKAQNDLCSRDLSIEPALVWFLAYQGGTWLVHCCTYELDKVKIYNIWQGTILSRDGALQLLLIVDYIWSWARDVYRPTIRNLQSRFVQGSRDFSPASTDQFRTSVSVSSRQPSIPNSHDQESAHGGSVMFNVERIFRQTSFQQVEHESRLLRPSESFVKDASSHDFLKCAIDHAMAPSWTRLGSVRHSNIVHFELRCYEITTPELYEVKQADPDAHLFFQKLARWTIQLLPDDLHWLAEFWTRNSASIPNIRLDSQVQASFFLQTYCDPATWQIKRILNCMIWRTDPHRVAELPQPGEPRDRLGCSLDDIKRSLVELQRDGGKYSVQRALDNSSSVLIPGQTLTDPKLNMGWGLPATWTCFDTAGIPAKASLTLKYLTDRLDLGDLVIDCVNICSGLLRIQEKYPKIRKLRNPRSEQSMLAIRPQWWPLSTSKFCLFVFYNEDLDGRNLGKLLGNAIDSNLFHVGEDQPPLHPPDRERLRKWRRDLQK